MPSAHAARVFERLCRAGSSRTRGNGGGSGLGLSIVAAIVHGHGGSEVGPSEGTVKHVKVGDSVTVQGAADAEGTVTATTVTSTSKK